MNASPNPFTIVDVFEEIDDVVYTFPDPAALEAWALHGEETFTAVRPATTADVPDVDTLWAMFNAPTAKGQDR